MALVRWEPFRELTALQNEMGRWMSQFAGATPGNGQSATWLPAVDVWETEEELVLSFDLPGIAEDRSPSSSTTGFSPSAASASGRPSTPATASTASSAASARSRGA